MSLLSNKSLDLHIGARAVHGVLRPAWSRHKVLAKARQEFGLLPGDNQAAESVNDNWTACSQAIDSVLSDLGVAAANHKNDLRIVLADSRVHFDVVSGDYGGASERHLEAIATACVIETLGERASRQIVRWQLQPDMRHLLISSIDTQDIESVAQVASRHQLSVTSFQPDFCAKWNQYAKTLPGGTGVFTTSSDGHLIVVFALAGSIAALSCGSSLGDGRVVPYDIRSKDSVDERVDRLLSSVGRDASEISTFIMVAPNQEHIPKSLRWTVINLPQEPA